MARQNARRAADLVDGLVASVISHAVPERVVMVRSDLLRAWLAQSTHWVLIAGAAWMQTSRAGPGPELVNPCGTPAGPITMSPGPPSRVSFPTLTRTWPSRMTKVSS